MEKRRVRLEINGVVCGLITQESEEYMQALAQEVGGLMKNIQEASPYITREAAALTAALSYCDDSKKNGKRADELKDRLEELEVEAEIWQEDREKIMAQPDPKLEEELASLRKENSALHAREAEAGALREQLETLREENELLRGQARLAEEGRDDEAKTLLAQLEALREENAGLKETCRKAEEEKAEYKNAAMQAVERAREIRAKAQEQMDREPARQPVPEAGAAPGEEKPAVSQPPAEEIPKGRFRNPLRHDELEQQGLVSFFEKK